jgi:predicted acetyltransferase
MAPEVRLIDADEIGAWTRSASVPFLRPAQTDELRARWDAHWRPHLEVDRTWAVAERGRFVGNANVFSRTVTLPAAPGRPCAAVPVAAISGVGVHPTHRRQGLLRRLMAAMLDDARRRGEAVAALTASQAAIYGRFGFAPATSAATTVIDTARSAFAGPAPERAIDLLEPAEAAKVLPGLFDAATAAEPGHISRTDAVWAARIADDPDDRLGASARWYATCPDGYAVWRTEAVRTGPGDEGLGRVLLEEVVAADPRTEAALWRFVADLDLVCEVVADKARPGDDPIRHRLADPRALRTVAVSDFLWLRVLDTPAALSARGYLRSGRLVLDVRAPAATPTGPDGVDGPDPAAGVWVLETGPDGATCRPARPGEGPDLVLGVAELSVLLAGGGHASVLAAAGRVDEVRPGAAGEADDLFASRPAPMCITEF